VRASGLNSLYVQELPIVLIRNAITVILCILVFTPQHVCTCHFAFGYDQTQNRDTISPPDEPCHCHDHDAFCDSSDEVDLESHDGFSHDSQQESLSCECDQSWVAIEPSSSDPPNRSLDDIELSPREFVTVHRCSSIRSVASNPPSIPRYLALLNLRI